METYDNLNLHPEYKLEDYLKLTKQVNDWKSKVDGDIRDGNIKYLGSLGDLTFKFSVTNWIHSNGMVYSDGEGGFNTGTNYSLEILYKKDTIYEKTEANYSTIGKIIHEMKENFRKKEEREEARREREEARREKQKEERIREGSKKTLASLLKGNKKN